MCVVGKEALLMTRERSLLSYHLSEACPVGLTREGQRKGVDRSRLRARSAISGRMCEFTDDSPVGGLKRYSTRRTSEPVA